VVEDARYWQDPTPHPASCEHSCRMIASPTRLSVHVLDASPLHVLCYCPHESRLPLLHFGYALHDECGDVFCDVSCSNCVFVGGHHGSFHDAAAYAVDVAVGVRVGVGAGSGSGTVADVEVCALVCIGHGAHGDSFASLGAHGVHDVQCALGCCDGRGD